MFDLGLNLEQNCVKYEPRLTFQISAFFKAV